MRIFDIHTHILPFVDDGSRSLEDSLNLLSSEIREGVTDFVFTPHYRLDWMHTSFSEVKEVFAEFCARARENGLNANFYLGQELHDAPAMPEEIRVGRGATLNGTKYFLLELDWGQHNDDILSVVSDYVESGFVPIIVHYERFRYKDISEVEALRKAGALFQINSYSLFARENEDNRDFAMLMLERGFVDFVASDNHVGKFLDLKDGYELVSKKFGEKVAEDVFYNNAEKIIKG